MKKLRVAVNGDGVIGKRVEDANKAQQDVVHSVECGSVIPDPHLQGESKRTSPSSSSFSDNKISSTRSGHFYVR